MRLKLGGQAVGSCVIDICFVNHDKGTVSQLVAQIHNPVL
jgi:hypothetical protein